MVIVGTALISFSVKAKETKSAALVELSHLIDDEANISEIKRPYLKSDTTISSSKIDLNEIVVAASKWSTSLREVSSTVVSVSQKDIALQNPQTAADLLGLSGSVFIQKSQQGGGSPMIRGFATNRLLYSVDGVRMNSAIFRSGNIQNVINLDPFSIDKTEVLLGSGSTIYGSDAIGGVMSFATLKPQFSEAGVEINGKASVRTASANKEKTGHFDVNIGTSKWAFVSSVSHWDYDNLKQGSHGPDDYIKPYYVERQNDEDVVVYQDDKLLQIPSAYSQLNLLQKVRYSPIKEWDLTYAFHWSETSSYGRYDRHNRVKEGLPRYAEWNYGPQKWMMNHISVVHDKANRLYDKMQINLAYQQFKESRISRSLNSLQRKIQSEEVQAYSVNIDLTKNIRRGYNVFYGAEYVLNDVASRAIKEDIQDGSIESAAARYPNATWQSVAAYFTNNYRLSRRSQLQAGLRYNHMILDANFTDNLEFYPLPFNNAKLNNGALSGNIGWILRCKNELTLKTNIGTAFRSPNVDDIGKVFDSEPGAVTVPNRDLKPEYAYTADIGIHKTIANGIKLNCSAYYTLLTDALVRRDFNLNGKDSILYDGERSKVQAIQNAAEANVYGLQVSIVFEMSENLSLNSAFNWQKGEEEMDNGARSPSRHAAPYFGNIRLNYHKTRFSTQLYLLYQGEKKHSNLSLDEVGKQEIYALDENGNTYAPGWHTLNLKAQYYLSNNFTVSGGVENIFDERYRSYSSGISGAGRNILLSIQVDF